MLGVYWLARLFWIANPLFLTTFLGILFGLAVSKGVDRLAFLKIPRGARAGLIVLTFVGALVGFGASVAPTLREAVALSRKYAEHVQFAGKQMRRDIAWRELRREESRKSVSGRVSSSNA